MLIAQVSDMHLRCRGESSNDVVDTFACLKHCIARIESLSVKPDLVAFTGDLVDGGTRNEYRELRQQLSALSIP